MDFIKFFGEAEAKIIDAIADVSGWQYDSFLAQYSQALQALESDVRNETIDLDTQKEIGRVACNIKAIAEEFITISKDSARIEAQMSRDAAQILHRGLLATTKSDKLHTAADNAKEAATNHHFRCWFIDNIAHPFPSKETKYDLVAESNALVKELQSNVQGERATYDQCQLWFINTRRRSKWTDFFRAFAHNDKGRMESLVRLLHNNHAMTREAVDVELSVILSSDTTEMKSKVEEMDALVLDCRNTWTAMINFIEQRVAEQAGDWMDAIIKDAKEEYKKEKKGRIGMRKRIREHQAMEQEHQCQQSQRKASASRRIARHAEVCGVQAGKRRKTATVSPSISPRQPSMRPVFRAPLRSASDTSSSSLESADTTAHFHPGWDSGVMITHPTFNAPVSPLQAYGRLGQHDHTNLMAGQLQVSRQAHEATRFADEVQAPLQHSDPSRIHVWSHVSGSI